MLRHLVCNYYQTRNIIIYIVFHRKKTNSNNFLSFLVYMSSTINHLMRISHLHPGKLTWNLKMNPFKRRFLLETIIFRFHVSFRGGMSHLQPTPSPTKTPLRSPERPPDAWLVHWDFPTLRPWNDVFPEKKWVISKWWCTWCHNHLKQP